MYSSTDISKLTATLDSFSPISQVFAMGWLVGGGEEPQSGGLTRSTSEAQQCSKCRKGSQIHHSQL